MSAKSKIEWTESSWNPLTGCTHVSLGCKNCYAERFAKRLKAMGNRLYKNGFKLTLHKDQLELPLHWKKPRMVFVNSMSDLFHEEVPFEFIKSVFDTMVDANSHCFQVLTKRAERLAEVSQNLPWPQNIWMGVTVENNEYIDRVKLLRKTDAAIKFISFEPLIGPIDDLDIRGIDWVIVGGESGPRSRPMNESWVLDIKQQCSELGIPFFFKQWGGTNKKKNGRLLKGRTWDEMPSKNKMEM